MKICLITNLYNPWVIGGAEIYAETIAKELSKKHEIIVITTKPFSGLKSLKPEIEIKEGIRIYRFFPANIYHTYNAKDKTIVIKPIWHAIDLWNPHSYLEISEILKKEKPDLIHTHNLGGISPSAFYAAKKYGVPVVHTLHDLSFICPRATMIHQKSCRICTKPGAICKTYEILKRKTTGQVDTVIAPSKLTLEMLKNKGFFKSTDNLIVLPYGVGTLGKPEKEKKETFDILYIGRIVTHKGIDTLINAFRGIKSSTIRLHIVGTGPDAERIKETTKDIRIIFHGFVSEHDKEGLFAKADICVVPSICYDNSPVVVYECFFHGVPVIGSRIGGIPELVKEGYNGILFEAGNANELKTVLIRLMNNPDEVKNLSEGALESCKEYTISNHVNRLMDIYLSSLNR
jgi:glycosyltransferase involved in cell wall biosynthesis